MKIKKDKQLSRRRATLPMIQSSICQTPISLLHPLKDNDKYVSHNKVLKCKRVKTKGFQNLQIRLFSTMMTGKFHDS